MTYKLFTDGGARGNPGPAAAGAILFDEQDHLIWFDSKYLGHTTNNKAEYQAILHGIKGFKKSIDDLHDTNIKLTCYLDSELIVKQLNGEYKIKDSTLKTIYERVMEQVTGFEVEFIHIYREKNKFADKLVNICLDAANEKGKNQFE